MSEVNSNIQEQTTSKRESAMLLIWLVLSIIVTILVLLGVGKNTPNVRYWKLALGFILAVPASFIATMIGNLLRKIAMPDVFISSGMADTLKKKLFWAIGPQLIGLGIGQFVIWGLLFPRF